MSKHYLTPMSAHETALEVEEQAHPGLDEVLQRPEAPIAVPVKHNGPVQTHELPSRFGTCFSVPVTSTPQQILGADRQRKRAVLIGDAPFLVSISRSIVGTGTAALWPANVPLELRHCDAVTLATQSLPANVPVITENWAE